MKKAIVLTSLFLLCASWVSAAPFTPGNIVLSDAAEDRLIEVALNGEKAVVVQVVTWELGDTLRRRPLGVDFDPNGTCYVGITGVPASATEVAEMPEGRGEILRILPDGTQQFFVLPATINKGTWISSDNPNEVFVMSNEQHPPFPSQSYRYRFQNGKISEPTLFNVTMTPQDNGNGGYGKALVLPDGRILIPSNTDHFINIYTEEGGDSIGRITTAKGYRSLAYIAGTNYMLANTDDGITVDKITMDGSIIGTFNFSLDSLSGVWNFTVFNDGTERFIVTNHNGAAASKSTVFVYDASNLDEIFPAIYPIAGLEAFGDADGMAMQLFDSAVVPEPARITGWSLF